MFHWTMDNQVILDYFNPVPTDVSGHDWHPKGPRPDIYQAGIEDIGRHYARDVKTT